jgi:hypothetical protein
MHSKGWAVIEAPDMEAARAIAHEVFGDRYAFIYDHEHFIADGTAARWHHSGELLRIRFDGVQTWADEGRLQ